MSAPSDLTFDAFTPCRGSHEGYRHSLALARNRPAAPRLLLLHGPPGCGKTHVLQATIRHAQQRHPWASHVLTSAEALVQDLVDSVRGAAPVAPRTGFARGDVLAVDDLHLLSGKPATQHEIAALFAAALAADAHVICASGCPPGEIPILAEALQPLQGARIIEMLAPSPAEMRRILNRLTAAEQVSLAAPAVASIATASRGDVRRAIGAIAHRRLELSLGGLARAARPPAD